MIQHAVLDRAIQTSLSRHIEELREMILAQTTAGKSVSCIWLQEQFAWVTFAGCALHDFHNGYKKGMHGYLTDRQFMAGLYERVASHRDSFSSMMTGIGL